MMKKKYHFNSETGNAGECQAQPGNCWYGDEELHFNTKGEARRAYELFNHIFPPVRKKEIRQPLSIPLPPEVDELLYELSRNGGQPYIVGGSVRDVLLGLEEEPKDFDIEVQGIQTMQELSSAVQRAGMRVDEVGKAFGVIKAVSSNGVDIDVSLPRRDSLVGTGHKDFLVETLPDISLSEAAERRDFTINALYYDPLSGEVIDTVGGLADIENKTLRHVSAAFREDPLRVLRAAQFASRFDMTVHPYTVNEARFIKDMFSTLPYERVSIEFEKLYTKGGKVTAGLQVLKDTEWQEHFGLNLTDADIFGEFGQKLDKRTEASTQKDVIATAILLEKVHPNKRKDFLKNTLIGVKKQQKAQKLFEEKVEDVSSTSEVRVLSRKLHQRGLTISDWYELEKDGFEPEKAEKVWSLAQKAGVTQEPPHSIISGDDILMLSSTQKHGKWVGEILQRARHAQDHDVFSDRNSALLWLKQQKDLP